MQLDNILLEMAKRDLEAAKILYSSGLYPQSIFYLQQSVEKMTKSFALRFKIITENELLEIGHNSLLILKKLIEGHGETLDTICDAINKIPKFGDLTIIKELNIPDQYEDLEKTDVMFNDIIKVKKELLFYPEEYIIQLFNELKQIESEIEKAQSELVEEDFQKLKEILLQISDEFCDKFPQISLQKIDKHELEEYISSKEFIELLKKIISAIFDSIYIFPSLIYLSMITFPHAIIARYPQDELNPLKIYTDKLPIIRFFGECTKIMEKTIKKVESMYEMQEVSEHAIH